MTLFMFFFFLMVVNQEHFGMTKSNHIVTVTYCPHLSVLDDNTVSSLVSVTITFKCLDDFVTVNIVDVVIPPTSGHALRVVCAFLHVLPEGLPPSPTSHLSLRCI